jgi:hypothetical protein
MKYFLTLHAPMFPIDTKTLLVRIKAVVPQVAGFNTSKEAFDFIISEDMPLIETQLAVKNFWESLQKDTEALALAKNSRKSGPEMMAFLNSKKELVAAKDWSAMSPAERKLAMGATLTDDEIDSL